MEWLPELVTLESYGGDWEAYIAGVHEIFTRDLLDAKIRCQGIRVELDRRTLSRGRCEAFWHITSADASRGDREPDLRRCERIGWIPAIISQAGESGHTVLWHDKRKSRRRLMVATTDFGYLVVFSQSRHTLFLVTAYPVTWPHQRRKLAKQFASDPDHLPADTA
jgi:hypothetical protein